MHELRLQCLLKGPVMPDIQIECQDCRAPFVHTEGEQKFYAERNFTAPKRCKACRQARKDQQGDRGPRRG